MGLSCPIPDKGRVISYFRIWQYLWGSCIPRNVHLNCESFHRQRTAPVGRWNYKRPKLQRADDGRRSYIPIHSVLFSGNLGQRLKNLVSMSVWFMGNEHNDRVPMGMVFRYDELLNRLDTLVLGREGPLF